MIPAVKICGITRVEDADAAIDAGAGYVGLIFAESSPRKVDLSVAQAIVKTVKGRVKVVAVFKDNPVKSVKDVVAKLEVDLVQFHGAELPEYVRAVGAPAMKVFEISPVLNLDSIRRYEGLIRYLLFDRPKGDDSPYWLDFAVQKISNIHQMLSPYFFAGGLTADNVADVVRRLNPYAVDVASGVESQPGIKDAQKMKEFCNAVREAGAKCGH